MRNEAFDALRRTCPRLCTPTPRTGDHVLAEDLLADTFERTLRARRALISRKASGGLAVRGR